MNPALGPGCGAGIQNVPNEPLLFTCDEDFIDEDFFPSMGIELKYGENFTPNAPGNTCIIDEELVRRWGETGNPCGKTISCNHYSYTIVGVVKSFHSGSWRYTNRGKFFHPIQPDDEATDWASPYISIRLTELSPENIATLTKKLKELHPDKSCNLSFYDDLKRALYDEERKSRNMIFAGVVLTPDDRHDGAVRLHQRRGPPAQQGDRHPESQRSHTEQHHPADLVRPEIHGAFVHSDGHSAVCLAESEVAGAISGPDLDRRVASARLRHSGNRPDIRHHRPQDLAHSQRKSRQIDQKRVSTKIHFRYESIKKPRFPVPQIHHSHTAQRNRAVGRIRFIHDHHDASPPRMDLRPTLQGQRPDIQTFGRRGT